MLPAKAMIVGTGAITSIGYCVPQIWASVRAGIARYACEPLLDSRFGETRLSLVDEADLEPLLPESEALGFSGLVRRMIRLAAPALREAVAGLSLAVPPPIFLGLPGPLPESTPVIAPTILSAIAKQADVQVDDNASAAFSAGRASFFVALDQGLRLLASGRAMNVIVGGVDSYFDPRVLGRLDREQRLLSDYVSDGFIPGEGAGFVVLARPTPAQRSPVSCVAGVGLAKDPGHRYADEPARGEGLSNAMNALFAGAPPGGAKIAYTLAGLNGESFGAKEWGVAQLRHNASFAAGRRLDHPADCHGDLGAATGAVLTALAHVALTNGHRQGPVLVWASSDHEQRGCALIDGASR
jgi:3-oxoacyl-[acyl-carrier-protein] synthase-1